MAENNEDNEENMTGGKDVFWSTLGVGCMIFLICLGVGSCVYLSDLGSRVP